MAKKNSMKKNKKEIIKFEPRKLLTKKILYLALFLILIITAYLFFRNSRYFNLNDIKIIDPSNAAGLDAGDLLKIYKGQNIFNIDIDALSSRIKDDYPSLENVVVKRVMPNALEIDVIPRIPIAKIKAHTFSYLPVDRSGMILSPELETGRLPVIIGLSIWQRPRVGKRLENQQIKNAFFLLDALKESSMYVDYNISTIDVSNYKNLSFYFEDGIEVKIGGEDFPERLKRLKETLDNPDLDKTNIKYIDLRFRDIVIGPK